MCKILFILILFSAPLLQATESAAAKNIIEKKDKPKAKIVLPPKAVNEFTRSTYFNGYITPFAGVVPTVGIGLAQDINEIYRIDFAYQAGRMTFPSRLFSAFSNDFWTVRDAKVSQRSWSLGIRRTFWETAFIGFGYKQKILEGDLACGGVNSNLLDFTAVALIWTQGLYVQVGKHFVLGKSLGLNVSWVGLDVPLESSYSVALKNSFLQADIGEDLLNNSAEFSSVVTALRHYPWPFLLEVSLTYVIPMP